MKQETKPLPTTISQIVGAKEQFPIPTKTNVLPWTFSVTSTKANYVFLKKESFFNFLISGSPKMHVFLWCHLVQENFP